MLKNKNAALTPCKDAENKVKELTETRLEPSVSTAEFRSLSPTQAVCPEIAMPHLPCRILERKAIFKVLFSSKLCYLFSCFVLVAFLFVLFFTSCENL